MIIRIYSIIENLVLCARSEITGFAMIECPGILECWNTGFSGMRSIYIYTARIRGKNKIPSAFHTQYSIFPPFHSVFTGKHRPSGVKSKPGPLGQDSLLFAVTVLSQ